MLVIKYGAVVLEVRHLLLLVTLTQGKFITTYQPYGQMPKSSLIRTAGIPLGCHKSHLAI